MGLTLREYLSGLAMQASIASGQSHIITIARDAVEYADALIVELNKISQIERKL